MVSFRGPPARRRCGLDEKSRSALFADWPFLGRQFSAERTRLVRSPNGGTAGLRCHRDLLFYAGASRNHAAPYEPAAGEGGICRVLCRHDPPLRACEIGTETTP